MDQFTQAALGILAQSEEPLHVKEITRRALAQGRLQTKGKTPEATMSAAITTYIPAEAYDYVVNGKSAIEWVMERYQIKTDPKSGITNDPKDWATEVNNPRFIYDLLNSGIHLSAQTMELVKGLSKLKFA